MQPNVNFVDPKLDLHLEELKKKSDENDLMDVILCMALCHTVILDTKKNVYTSASPDELALVNAAKQFGYEFSDRDKDENIIIKDKRKNKQPEPKRKRKQRNKRTENACVSRYRDAYLGTGMRISVPCAKPFLLPSHKMSSVSMTSHRRGTPERESGGNLAALRVPLPVRGVK